MEKYQAILKTNLHQTCIQIRIKVIVHAINGRMIYQYWKRSAYSEAEGFPEEYDK